VDALAPPTPLARAADATLQQLTDHTLPTWIALRRARRRYWPEIATELTELLGWHVNPETLRRWALAYGVADDAAAAEAVA